MMEHAGDWDDGQGAIWTSTGFLVGPSPSAKRRHEQEARDRGEPPSSPPPRPSDSYSLSARCRKLKHELNVALPDSYNGHRLMGVHGRPFAIVRLVDTFRGWMGPRGWCGLLCSECGGIEFLNDNAESIGPFARFRQWEAEFNLEHGSHAMDERDWPEDDPRAGLIARLAAEGEKALGLQPYLPPDQWTNPPCPEGPGKNIMWRHKDGVVTDLHNPVFLPVWFFAHDNPEAHPFVERGVFNTCEHFHDCHQCRRIYDDDERRAWVMSNWPAERKVGAPHRYAAYPRYRGYKVTKVSVYRGEHATQAVAVVAYEYFGQDKEAPCHPKP